MMKIARVSVPKLAREAVVASVAEIGADAEADADAAVIEADADVATVEEIGAETVDEVGGIKKAVSSKVQQGDII